MLSSAVRVQRCSSEREELKFRQPASGHKCARCWNFMPEVSDYGIWQNVCTPLPIGA